MRFIIKTLLFILLVKNFYAQDIKPSFILKSHGLVNDFVIDGTKLYVANDEGSVEIFDLQNQKLIDEIFIQPSFSTKGKLINAKILSVDRHNGKTLIVSTTTQGYRNLWIHDGNKLKHIISTKDKIAIKEARFLDDKNFIFGTLGYELRKYTINDNYTVYKTQPEQSSFSDMVLSEDKKILVSASESGQVTVSEAMSGKILKKYNSLNVDNIYKIAFKHGNIITAGQDRRVGVYPSDAKPYYIKSNFLVYCVALSPDGKTGIYSSDEDNNLQLFDINTGKKTHRLIGHQAIPSTIKFFDKYGVFSAGYENSIYYWHLKDLNK